MFLEVVDQQKRKLISVDLNGGNRRDHATGDMVTVALPNSVDWFVAVAAAWKLGATPQPVGAHLPTPALTGRRHGPQRRLTSTA